MPIVVLKLPNVKSEADQRPHHCPSCQGEILQRWGGRLRNIRNPQVRWVTVYRYRCCRCRHTFRYYPAGVDQAQQSQSLRKLAALMKVRGKSVRGYNKKADMVAGLMIAGTGVNYAFEKKQGEGAPVLGV